MLGYLVRRLLSAVLVLIATSVAVVALFTYGPRDPAQAMCPEPKCTHERQVQIREALHLDKPIYVQYGEYMEGIIAGRDIAVGSESWHCAAPCFGRSFIYNTDVWRSEVKPKIFPTISVAVGGSVMFIVIGVPLGIFAARRRGTLADRSIIGVTLFISAVPYYLVVLLGFLYLAVRAGIFPQEGYHPFLDDPVRWLWALLLPWFCLGLSYSSQYSRFMRGSMIEALSDDYVRTAKAKGLAQRKVVYTHALRAAIVPIVTIFGIDLGILLAGTIFTESIFNIPGLGLTALRAVSQGDLPIIEATTLFSAAVIIVANVVVDLLYSVLDPRVRIS